MNRKNKRVSGAKKAKLHRLLFVDPKGTVSMDELADRLIALRLVQEIFLAGHGSGYAAKVRFFPEKEPRDARAYVAGLISKDYGSVVKA
ncbi:MAG: hypothetical protein LVQ95_01900 [Candidatus Micrarchaeales archaeon]|nr:hypothetical protein [Candidatus Micrarchaeales archaeon]